MMRRALRKPHTSAMQSLIMYETGKTISPAVTAIGPNCTTLVSNRFAATRHTQNTMPKTIKGTDTRFSFFIAPVFYVVVLEYTEDVSAKKHPHLFIGRKVTDNLSD